MNMQVKHSMILCEKRKNCNDLLAPAHPRLWGSSGPGGEDDSLGSNTFAAGIGIRFWKKSPSPSKRLGVTKREMIDPKKYNLSPGRMLEYHGLKGVKCVRRLRR